MLYSTCSFMVKKKMHAEQNFFTATPHSALYRIMCRFRHWRSSHPASRQTFPQGYPQRSSQAPEYPPLLRAAAADDDEIDPRLPARKNSGEIFNLRPLYSNFDQNRSPPRRFTSFLLYTA